MKWDDYRQIYLNYELSVTQTRLISVISGEILREFPKNIPKDIGVPVFRKLKEIFETMSDYFERTRSQDKNASLEQNNENNADINNEKNKKNEVPFLIDEIFTLTTLIANRGIRLKDIDFQRILYSQELVMHHSNFEGILTDSMRTICYVCPDVMKRKRTIEWEEILSCGCWDELMDTLVEKFVRDMGWETLEKRLALFTDFLNLDIQFDENDITIIKEVELIRNLIVHNGGKVNQEYIALKNAKGLKIGDYIPLDADYLKLVSTTLNMVASEIYIEISKKYFGKEEDDILVDIWHRRGL